MDMMADTVGMGTINYEAAWRLYYTLADRRNKAGLIYDELVAIIDAAVTPTTPNLDGGLDQAGIH